ncbi:MAG: DUF805 domain-containing protein [Pseudomonadota bacterium]
MNAANPYQAPRSNVDFQSRDDDYSEVKVLSVSGRIGRLRYLGYGIGYSILIYLAFALVGGLLVLLGLPRNALMGIVMLAYVPIIILSIMLAIQRAHDFNKTGWLSLLAFVPFVSLIFLFIPGTDGENRFGKQTPPNRSGMIWLVLIPVFIGIVGIMAAIAIPAYQSYVKKAQAAAHSTLPAPAQPQ